MKILLVTLEYPPTIGGISTYLKELYKNFPGTVRVVSPHTHKMLTKFFWPHWLPFYFELKKIVALERPDEIHVSHVLPVGRLALWIFRSQKIPYRVIVHGTDILTARAQPRKWRSVLKILSRAKSCIVTSEATKKLFIDMCGSAVQEPVVITPGVAVPAVPHELAEELVVGHGLAGQRIILCVARLVPRKGVCVAVQALNLLLKIPVAASLVIVGAGPERERAELLAQQLGITDHVYFVGAASELEKWAWYKAARLFWFPAQLVAGEWEGFGITSLEAQASGCPAVVSNLHGLPETVIDGVSGFVVEPTAEAFAAHSMDILQNASLWQTMRQAARSVGVAQSWATQRQLFSHHLGL